MNRTLLRKKTAKTFALVISLPNLAYAAVEETPGVLPTIEVQAEDSAYLKTHASSSKRTEPLLNTAKTTQIITSQALNDQKLFSLQEALATTPGITFGAGEGNGGYGDKINIRGYSSDNNVTVDGLRDAATQVRSDLFNYEAVEITKGANSAENGVGQNTGGINLVTKTPKNRNFSDIDLGLGTDEYKRITADFNRLLNEDVAVRLNIMGHKDEYAGRPEKRERWAVAPSITFGINSSTKATLSYYHQDEDNTPLNGVPFFNARPVKGISASNYYGYLNYDQADVTTDTATIKIETEINPNLKLNSITRYSDITQDTTSSVPRGTFCLADGTMPVDRSTDASGYTTCTTGVEAGTYVPGGPRGFINDSNTKQIAHDTNVVGKFNTGQIQHSYVAGFGLTLEDYEKHGGSLNFVGTTAEKTMDVYNPVKYWYGGISPTYYLQNKSSLDIYSAYLTDTIKLTPQWIINLGLRYDRTDGSFKTFNTSTGALTSTAEQNDNLFSYNLSLLFKPTPKTSVYLNYSNSEKPTMSSAQTSCTTGTTCDVDPEEAVNYEIGAKWAPLEDLLLTVAVFRNEQNKVRVSDQTSSTTYSLDGQNHIDGIEVGIAGKITPKWDITASAAWMEGEYDQNVADSSTTTDYAKGDKLTNVPDWSGSLWNTYQINDQWKLGYGITYQGKIYVTQSTASMPYQYEVDDYIVQNASITYYHNKALSFNLMVKNLADEEYYTKVRTATASMFAMPGEGRRTIFSVNYKF
jgi:catecholate siderophore receptor